MPCLVLSNLVFWVAPRMLLGHCRQCQVSQWISACMNYRMTAWKDMVDPQSMSHRVEENETGPGLTEDALSPICSFVSWYCNEEENQNFGIFWYLCFCLFSQVPESVVIGFLKLSLYLWKYALWELQTDISVITFLKMYLDVGIM